MKGRPELSRAALSEADYFAVEFEPARGELWMLDQRRLPGEVVYHCYDKPDEVVAAIADMVVRGAPAIGIAAAYGLALQARLERGSAQMFLIANGIAGRRSATRGRPPSTSRGRSSAWAAVRPKSRALDADSARCACRRAEAIHREDVQRARRWGGSAPNACRSARRS